MLEVGNGGMNFTEERTHFALWCLIKAPLLIGCDLTKASNQSLGIMKAELLIKVNQDSLGNQATCMQDCDTNIPVYKSFQKDEDGYFALVVINWSNYFNRSTSIDLIKGGVAPSMEYMCYYSDLWTGATIGSSRGKVHVDDVPIHGHVALRVFCKR